MKQVAAIVIQPPSNLMDFKLLWVNETLEIANRIYSKEVKVENSFFNETNPLLISCLMEQHLKSQGSDILIIVHNIKCDLVELLTKAFNKNDKKLPRQFTLVQIMDNKVTSVHQTMGVYNDHIHYANHLNLKAQAINEYLNLE